MSKSKRKIRRKRPGSYNLLITDHGHWVPTFKASNTFKWWEVGDKTLMS